MDVRCPNCGTSMQTSSSGVVLDNNAEGISYLVPQTIRNENANKKSKSMDRLEKLNQIKFLTEEYKKEFGENPLKDSVSSIDIPEITDGYVKNTKLHRRWVMAQTFKLLRDDNEWTERFNRKYNFKYQVTMMLEEFRVQKKLFARDSECYEERNAFFNSKVLTNFVLYLNDQIMKYMLKEAKGAFNSRKYGMVFRHNERLVNVASFDVNDYLFHYETIYGESESTANYRIICELHNFLKKNKWYSKFNRLCSYKEAGFVDAFKGAGAYYTMKNMIMFHNCFIYDNGTKLSQKESLEFIKKSIHIAGYRQLAMLKKMIEDNKFSWANTVKKLYFA